MYQGHQSAIEFANFKIFKKAGEIHGKGSDISGPYEVLGRISNNLCTFIKRYPASQQTMIFSGILKASIIENKFEIDGVYCQQGYEHHIETFHIEKCYNEMSGSESE